MLDLSIFDKIADFLQLRKETKFLLVIYITKDMLLQVEKFTHVFGGLCMGFMAVLDYYIYSCTYLFTQ